MLENEVVAYIAEELGAESHESDFLDSARRFISFNFKDGRGWIEVEDGAISIMWYYMDKDGRQIMSSNYNMPKLEYNLADPMSIDKIIAKCKELCDK